MDIHRCRFVDYSPGTITATAFSLASTSQPVTVQTSLRLRLAVGRSNGDIEIWNPRHNWAHELTLPGSRGRSIEGLVWATAEGEEPRLFSIGGSTYITEWDLASGRPKTNYDCNAGVIWSIDVNARADKLAVGCDDGSVVIVDISGGFGHLEHDFICQRQTARVLSLTWFESEFVIGGCSDARVRTWLTQGETKGRLLNTMRVDKSQTEGTLVWSVLVLKEKRQIVSGDSTGSIKFWDLDNFSLLQTFKVHEADVLALVKDLSEEKIFTAGVDRKIHQFDLITNNKSKITKWVHTHNRLLHSNDVRTMSIFECKNYNFFVSGGVERLLVLQTVHDFYSGKYRKLGVQRAPVFIDKHHRLVVQWQDQTVKIWQVGDSYKLVAKLALADDENITSVALSASGSLLAVGRLTSVRLFRVLEDFSVEKIRDDKFDEVVDGAKTVLFAGEDLLIHTPDDELYKFKVGDTVELIDEIETLDTPSSPSYAGAIKHIAIEGDRLALSRYNGSIEIHSLTQAFKSFELTKLTAAPQVIAFNNTNLLVIAEDNRLTEYVTDKKTTTFLTSWSQTNSDHLPAQYLELEDKPQGLFVDKNRVWVYGANWLCFFDLSATLPRTNQPKKRDRDGLSIQDDEDDDEAKEHSRSRKNHKLKGIFWITQKYRPVLAVGPFGKNQIAVVEKEMYATTAAFDLPKMIL